MAYRQRSIPVISKSEMEVQTDVKLLQSNLIEQQHQQEEIHATHSDIRLSRVYNTNGLLRPFTDQQLLRQFSKTLQELRSVQPSDKTYGKRLELLQKQIDGLLKRDMLINGVAEGDQNWNSYYLTLNQKQKTIIRSQNDKIHTDVKIQKLRKQIETLDKQVSQLRTSLVNSQKAVEQNKLYASFYQRVNQVVNNGKNKGVQLLQVIEEQIVPITNQFTYNLAALTRTINKDIHQSTRAVVLNLAKEFDRLLKEQQFSEEKLNQTVIGLINNFKAIKGVDYLKNQFESSLKTQQSEDNYRNMLSLFKHEVQILKEEGRGGERLDSLLRKLEGARIELFQCKGWVNLVSPQIRLLQVNADDTKLKQLIGVLAGEFKKVYVKFPELKNHISPKLIDIFESQVLVELIEGGSIDKLSSIIIHSTDTVRVDNVYQYESSIDRKTVFHLRVLLKRLLQQLQNIKNKHGIDFTLDEGILNLLREHIIDGFNTEDYISLFRPIPKIVEVPIVVETPVYETKTFEKGVPIYTERQIVLREEKMSVVPIHKEVPVYIEKAIDHVIHTSIPVTIETQKAVPVDISREVIVQKVVESTVEVPTIRQKAVPVYEREQVVRQIEVQKLVDKVQLQQVEKIVQIGGREYVQVERIVQKPIYLYETRQQIKEVQVKVPQIIKQTEYVAVEKRVPYIIEHREIVNIEREVPIEIRVPEIEVVEVIEYRDKPIVVKQYREVVKEIPITKQKELLRETPKQIFIERSHFVKSDQIEVIRQVEVFVDKPIIREILTTKNVQIEKVVPLYITEQVPVIHQISVPYVEQKIKELQVQVVKIVREREEVVKPIHVEKQVPVVVQKQVVRIEKQIVERIVQKIVEVPRVVEIERIVEKIVVVPRIVERIVEVPKIIERIVVVQKPVLQLVEIQVPYVVIQQVEKIKEVVVEKIVVQYQKEIQIVEIEKVVERIIERDRPVEVQVERRIPYEVIREVAVPTYRDRIDYKRMEIHEVKVETIEVQVPFLFQQQVPFYVQRPIVTEHLVEQPIYEKLYIQKEKPIINEVQRLVIREVVIERPVITEVVKQVPGPETIQYVDKPQIVEVVHEKIVELHDRVEVPKEIYLLQQKVVHEIHQRLVQVPVNSIVTTPQLLEIPKLVYLTHYKQIAVDVPVREQRVRRDIIEQIKSIEVTREVPVQIQICRQKIKEITNEIRQYITSQIVRQIHTEVEVRSPVEYRQVQVAGQTIVQEINSSSRAVEIQDKIIERVVEKIVMLPQIVEVVRNIHHISEVNSLGVAVDVDITLQTERFQGVSQQLRKALLQLLTNFRNNVSRQPELKNLIEVIQKHLKLVDDWIAFPKLIQIPKEVVREVEKEKVVLVPTPDKQKQAVLAYILEKLVNELRRIKDEQKIQSALDEELLNLFFTERRGEEGLEGRLQQLSQSLKDRTGKFGSWGESNPFLVNSFLQDHFSFKTMVEETNRIQEGQIDELNSLRHQLDIATNKYENLLCFNRKMYDDNSTLIRTLEKYKSSIQDDQFNENLRTHREFYDQLAEEKHSLVLSSIKKTYHETESIIEGLTPQQGEGRQSFGELVGKLSQYENRNHELVSQTRALERQVQKYTDELSIKNNTIQRLQNDFEIKLTRAKEEMARNPNVNRELSDSNRELQEKNRLLERQVSNQKLTADRIKKELERNLQNLRRDYDGKLEKKDKEVKEVKETVEKVKKQSDREINKVKLQLDRLKTEKDRFEAELVQTQRKAAEQITAIKEQQLGTASEKQAQLLSQNMELRQSREALEQEYNRLKQAALDSNLNHDKQLSKLRHQIQRLNKDKTKSDIFSNIPHEAQRKNVELTKKIQTLEAELNQLIGKDQESSGELRNLRQRVKKLELELETSKMEVQISRKQKLQSTTFGSSGNKPITSLIEPAQGSGLGSASRSPRASGYKSTYEKGFMSPEISQSREQLGEGFVSSSSRVSRQSGEQLPMSSPYKSQMSLRDFMQAKNPDQKQRDICITFIMIKVIQKLEQEVEMGRCSSYSPSNIMIGNFNVKSLDDITIKLGYPITSKSNKTDGLYLAPEIIAGGVPSKKSLVFSLGVILDELIHGNNFFKSTEEIQNVQIEFRVRGEKMNPILKNTLFEMMSKDANKRLELLEAKRRLSLQKYISSEGRGGTTSSTRYTRPT